MDAEDWVSGRSEAIDHSVAKSDLALLHSSQRPSRVSAVQSAALKHNLLRLADSTSSARLSIKAAPRRPSIVSADKAPAPIGEEGLVSCYYCQVRYPQMPAAVMTARSSSSSTNRQLTLESCSMNAQPAVWLRLGQFGMFAEFRRLRQLRRQNGHQLRHIELDECRVGSHEAANIDRGREHVVIASSRARMWSVRILVSSATQHREVLGLPRMAELFCDRDIPQS